MRVHRPEIGFDEREGSSEKRLNDGFVFQRTSTSVYNQVDRSRRGAGVVSGVEVLEDPTRTPKDVRDTTL